MNHRSGMDASLLHVETPGMPMHVGSLQILDLPADDAGDFYEDVKRYGAGRMHLADVFQRKLALMPFELANRSGSMTKTSTSATTFAMSSCPGPARPGTWAPLERYGVRLHSGLLDRSRPLRETDVIEGLATGQRAIYNEVQHAAIDGQADLAVTKALRGDVALPAPTKPPRPRPRTNPYQLGVAELAGACTDRQGRRAAADRTQRQVFSVAGAGTPRSVLSQRRSGRIIRFA